MQFSYANLWNTLEKSGITKAELRQRLGMSSATMAKLSANQPVAMEILAKICDELGCALSDVVTYEGGLMYPSAWKKLTADAAYLLKIFFYCKEETEKAAEYIYGFATPFQMSEGGMDRWQLYRDDKFSEFYIVDGYLTGTNLQKLISAAMKKAAVGEILEELGIKLDARKDVACERILMSSICNGEFVYRPAFILPAENDCLGIREEMKPLLSFEEEATICESLFGRNKKFLYMDGNVPDVAKAKKLWNILKKELPLHHNFNEMARLNNFEVFSRLLDNRNEDSGIRWEVVDHEDRETGRKIADTLKIQLDHQRLHGRFAVNIQLRNTENPFSDTMEIVYCDEEDVQLQRALAESVSYVEIKVWKLEKAPGASAMIYHSSATLIREFHFNMQIHERSMILEDEWTRKMEHAHKEVDKKAEFYSGTPFSFGNTENEPWYNEERNVQKDFRELFGGQNPGNIQGVFFADNVDKPTEFLCWLKKILKSSNVHRVILIDPYIEAETIIKFIRSISNNGVAYELFTDSFAGKNAGENSERIKKIRKISESLEFVAPSNFLVRTLADNQQILHDRFLILFDDHLTPKVFTLTNSLDGMAQKHASLVTQLNNHVAREVFDYYIHKFADMKEQNKLETLFDSVEVSVKEVKKEAEKETKALPFEAAFENFKANFEERLPETLASLAYMEHKEKEKCIAYVKSLDITEVTGQFIQILEDASMRQVVFSRREKNIRSLSVAQLMLKEFDFDGSLLRSAENLLDYSFEFSYFNDGWAVYYAAKLLWKINPKEYCCQLEVFVERARCYQTFGESSVYVIIAQMAGLLILSAACGEDVSGMLLRSPIPLLRAIGIIQILHSATNEIRDFHIAETAMLQQKITGLEALENPLEIFAALLYLMTSLQIQICRKPGREKEIQPLIDWVGEQAAATVVVKPDKGNGKLILGAGELYRYLQILYSRNSEDICKIFFFLWKGKALSKEETTEQLIQLCMEKYNRGMGDKKEFFRVQDIYESMMIIEYLGKIDKFSIKRLKKRMEKLERQLSGRLYRAFLRTQNYTLWKNSIDLYCCLVCLELYIASIYQEEDYQAGKAVVEFERIASNYTSVLEEYSEVYRLFEKM